MAKAKKKPEVEVETDGLSEDEINELMNDLDLDDEDEVTAAAEVEEQEEAETETEEGEEAAAEVAQTAEEEAESETAEEAAAREAEEKAAAEAKAEEEAKAAEEAAKAEAEAKAKADAEVAAKAAAAEAAKKAEPAQPAQAEPQPQAPTLEEQQKAYEKFRTDSEMALTSHYALNEEELDELNEEPAKIIPKLMARAHMNAYLAAVQFMQVNANSFVEKALRDRETYSEIEQKFKDRWPMVDIDGAHKDTVQKLGLAYRQANPQASTADFIEHVGAQAVLALRLAAPNGDTTQERKPVETPPSPPPFKPAGASKPGTGGQPQPANIFEQMAMEMETEELDLD